MSDEVTTKWISVLNSYSGRDKALRSIYFMLVLISTQLSKKRAQFAKDLLEFAKQLSLTRLVSRQLNVFQMLHSLMKSQTQLLKSFQNLIDNKKNIQFISTNNKLICKKESASTSYSSSSSSVFVSELHSKNNFLSTARIFFYSAFFSSSTALGQFVDNIFATIVSIIFIINAIVEFLGWIADAKIISFDSVRWFRYSLYSGTAALSVNILRSIRQINAKGWTNNSTWPNRLTLIGLFSDLISALDSIPSIKFGRNGKKLTQFQSTIFSLAASLISFYKTF